MPGRGQNGLKELNFSRKTNWVSGKKEVTPTQHIPGEMTDIADKQAMNLWPVCQSDFKTSS